MTLREILKTTEKLVVDNSPAILTAIGVTGTLATAYLTGKATFKAAEILSTEVYTASPDYNETISVKTKVEAVWKLYIPAAGAGVVTVASILFANRIGTRREAAVAAALTVSERAYSEYKDKVFDTIGKNKEAKLHDEIAQDRVTKNSVGTQQVIVTGGGDVLCFDMYTGRYFQSDMETLKKAQNDLNYTIIAQGYASLTDFYNHIGLSSTKSSDDMGWTSDKLLELRFSTTMSDDDRPCIALDFMTPPGPDFFRVH